MVKKFKILVLCSILVVALVACQQIKSNTTELVYEELSKREEYLLNLTGNKVLIYTLENLPQDKHYEIELIYEVYQDGEKVKEQMITAMSNDQTSEKTKVGTIALNIQEDKIKYLFGRDWGYASGSYNLEEDLSQYSYAWLSNDINLELGTEVYIYHANSSKSITTNITLGFPVTEDELNQVLKGNEENIFIKLSFKEL